METQMQADALSARVADAYGIESSVSELPGDKPWDSETPLRVADGDQTYQLITLADGRIVLIDQDGKPVGKL